MWSLRSFAFQTDLFLVGLSGEVIDRDRYLLLRTPSNPGYWWGNFLFYRDPPTPEIALADHAREFADPEATLIAWDRPDGDAGHADAFAPLGFEIDIGSILTARGSDLVAPKRSDLQIAIAPLETATDWADALECQTNAFSERRSGSLEDLRGFIERQHRIYRAIAERKVGRWWGARIDGEMAGVLGLVRVESRGLGRFQLVGVDPKFGRRGVCSTLVHHVARHALVEEGLDTLVMAADATYHAAKVYEGVGFRPTERLIAVIKKPPAE